MIIKVAEWTSRNKIFFSKEEKYRLFSLSSLIAKEKIAKDSIFVDLSLKKKEEEEPDFLEWDFYSKSLDTLFSFQYTLNFNGDVSLFFGESAYSSYDDEEEENNEEENAFSKELRKRKQQSSPSLLENFLFSPERLELSLITEHHPFNESLEEDFLNEVQGCLDPIFEFLQKKPQLLLKVAKLIDEKEEKDGHRFEFHESHSHWDKFSKPECSCNENSSYLYCGDYEEDTNPSGFSICLSCGEAFSIEYILSKKKMEI